MGQRVIENLNEGLGRALQEEEELYLLGEDLLDPYGGAFKATRGLSTRFPDRVLSTPISEAAIVAAANGLALAGHKAIAEIMFGDFVCLAFDQIVNFAAKSVSMFGSPQTHSLIVRCPIGGNRGYGATHSQSLQKHFIGVPDLNLFEMTAFHDNYDALTRMFSAGKPAVFFENKLLYGMPFEGEGRLDDLFEVEFIDDERNFAGVQISDRPDVDALILTMGGCASMCVEAAREMFLDEEWETRVIVPSQIYPLSLEPLKELLAACPRLFVVEESTAGGTWGAEVAVGVQRLLGHPRRVEIIHSADNVIPAARHLEKHALVQVEDILARMRTALAAS